MTRALLTASQFCAPHDNRTVHATVNHNTLPSFVHRHPTKICDQKDLNRNRTVSFALAKDLWWRRSSGKLVHEEVPAHQCMHLSNDRHFKIPTSPFAPIVSTSSFQQPILIQLPVCLFSVVESRPTIVELPVHHRITKQAINPKRNCLRPQATNKSSPLVIPIDKEVIEPQVPEHNPLQLLGKSEYQITKGKIPRHKIPRHIEFLTYLHHF